jgi:hypothetical protein
LDEHEISAEEEHMVTPVVKSKSHKKQSEGNKKIRGPLWHIKMKCRKDCLDGPKAVRYCEATDCLLWPFRFGKYPKRVIREEGEAARRFVEPAGMMEKDEEHE